MRFISKINKIMCRYTQTLFLKDRFLYLTFERKFFQKVFPRKDYNKLSAFVKNKYLHSGFEEKDIDELPEKIFENDQVEQPEDVKKLLFGNCKDPKMLEINKCVSVEDVLLLIQNSNLMDKHLTHAILVLHDLKNVFNEYNDFESVKFIETLQNKDEFTFLLASVCSKLKDYNYEYLSYTLLYLNKLGLQIENKFLEEIALEIKNRLLKQFSLDIAARFLKVIFAEYSLKSYYFSADIVPKVFSKIDCCNSIDDLSSLTTCLNKLHDFVREEDMTCYVNKIEEFFKCKKLSGENYKILIKIILFLNYPEWRNQNVPLITQCILSMRNQIQLLNLYELETLYEIFFRIQEPGDVLNIIQRSSASFLQQLAEESPDSYTETKLKLFSSLIYFSSPLHRIQFRKDVVKYIFQCRTTDSLLMLRKLFSYLKVSDEKLCKYYWDKTLILLKRNLDLQTVAKFSQNYMNFNTDISNYRHYEFENVINREIHIHAQSGELFIFPSVFSSLLSFFIVYGKSESLLDLFINQLKENWKQIDIHDCLKLSRSLNLLEEVQNKFITKNQYRTVSDLLSQYTEFKVENDSQLLDNSILIKAAILRQDTNEVVDDMLMKFKHIEYMSSKMIENMYFFLMSTNSLIPEVINKCTEYVVNNKNVVLGFNAEKVLNMCFNLNYHPVNSEKFFDNAVDIIIRDQERLSGLALIQSALSLSFFNKLPKSFVKQIFNVEFLNKLDTELAHCYSKDKYPVRVRNNLMMLNRCICLEYPEYEIPWFHQKYVDEFQKRVYHDDDHFFLRFKDYLLEIIGKKEDIAQNVKTPYGYHVDFVVNIDQSSMNSAQSKIAILLIRNRGFTRFYTRLKGKLELQKRHLEILGYKVKIVRFDDWINLLYAQERLDFVKQLLHTENYT